MAGSGMLFACTKCHSRHKFEDLSKEEQLCKDCRRKFPLVSCNYCKLEFHILKKIDGGHVCAKCAHNLKAYGKPKNCRYCTVKAAFKDKCCVRCISSEKKYGPPVKCQGCSLSCAFNKSKEAQSKVSGKILCLQCTLKFKKDRHKVQKQQLKEQKYKVKSDFSTTKTSHPVLAPLKAENITKSLYKTGIDPLEHTSRHSVARVENNNSFEPTFGDHMTELTTLREQMIQLKKTIAQKEKIILEKDKKINEFQAEQWEREKLLRTKNQNLTKEYHDRIENLQLENGSLRKQVRELSKTKKTPKLDRVSSRIRLEPHKISLTPTSGRSPEHKKEEPTTEESGTEPETTAEESQNQVVVEKKTETEETDSNKPSEAESDDEDEKRRNPANDARVLKSFDEAQAGEIKKLLEDGDDGDNSKEEEEEEPDRNDERSDDDEDGIVMNTKKPGKDKSKHRKRKMKLNDDIEDEDDDDELEGKKKRKKIRKSKAILSDQEDNSDSDKETPTANKDDDVTHSDDEESSPKMEIDNDEADNRDAESDDDRNGADDDNKNEDARKSVSDVSSVSSSSSDDDE